MLDQWLAMTGSVTPAYQVAAAAESGSGLTSDVNTSVSA